MWFEAFFIYTFLLESSSDRASFSLYSLITFFFLVCLCPYRSSRSSNLAASLASTTISRDAIIVCFREPGPSNG